jgi:rubrerythrin
MLLSSCAKFHIALISTRWYQDSKQTISYLDLLMNYSYISLKNATNTTTSPEEILSKPFNLEYLRQMRADNNAMINLEESHNINKKMRYSTGFGILKKALNLAISLNCDDELLGILHRFIDDKQRLITTSTNNENPNSEIFSIQVTDPLVVRKRGAPSKRLKSSTESNNNTVRKYKKQALAPLDENLRSKSSRFIETRNNSVAVDKENETLIDTHLQDEGSANKYKCRVCGGFGHNARNKRKCPQQNSL